MGVVHIIPSLVFSVYCDVNRPACTPKLLFETAARTHKTSVNLLITMNLFEVCQSSFHFSLCLPHYASLLCLIFIQFRELLGMLPCTLINYHNDVRPDEVIFFPLCFPSVALACIWSKVFFFRWGRRWWAAQLDLPQLICSRPRMCYCRHFRW